MSRRPQARVRRPVRICEPAPVPRKALADVLAPPSTLATADAAFRAARAARLGLAADAAPAALPANLAAWCGGFGIAATEGFIGYPRCAELAQDGLMRRGVAVTADEMTRNFPRFIGAGGAESSDAARRLNDEMDRLDVVARFHDMAAMCGQYGGGLLYLRRRGDGAGVTGDLAAPISVSPEFFRDGALDALVAVEPVSVGPLAYNATNPLAGDYFEPRTWYVSGVGEVHASRFLHFSTGALPVILRPAYNFFGVPQVQLALDYLVQFTDDRESAARLLKKFSLTIFKTNADELLYGGDDSQVARRIRHFAMQRDNDGVFAISNEDEDVVQVNTPLSGVTDIVRQALEMLAVIWGIPVVKFLGVSPGGMNATGESDLRSFYDHIESQRQKIFAHNFERLAQAMQYSLFGELREDVSYTWPSLWELNERERGELAKLRADTDAIYLDRGVLGQEEVRAALGGDEEGRYAGIEPDAVPEPLDAPGGELTAPGLPDSGGENLPAALANIDRAGEVPA